MGELEQVVLVGAFKESLELCEDAGLSIIGIFDPTDLRSVGGYPILGSDETARREAPKWSTNRIVVILDQPAARQRVVALYESWGYHIRGVVSPHAAISRSADVQASAIIQRGVNISANVRVSDHVRLNTNCNIMHDVHLGAFATVAPNAVLLGRVEVGEGAYIGANATVLPNKTIGKDAVVGAGAVVTHDIPPGIVVAGNPARVLSSIRSHGRE